MTNETIIAEIIDDETIDGSIELVGVKGEPGIGITTAQAGDSTQNNGYTVTPVTFNKSDGSKTTVDIRSKNGLDGNNGITPTIGENGNWFLEDVDTGKPSRGIQGLPGQDGENGQDGTDGVSITTITSGDPTQNDGFTVTPLTINKSDDSNVTINISAKNGIDGTVSFDNLTEEQKASLKGEKGDKGDTGEIGATGPQGDTGPAGPSNVLTIGTVTGGDAASATITGTSPNQVLNLVLPKGDTGLTGANGQDGVSITTITSGTPTQSGDYTVTPITINKSDSSNVTINVSAKNGLDGSQGTIDYEELENKPKINNVELVGNKSLSDIGVQQTVISETEPIDPSVEVWIDPSGDVTPVPTKTSDLVNDSGFTTEIYVTNAISTAIGDALGGSY